MTEPENPQPDWIARWQQAARRIRVPLGFLTAALYLFELVRHAPHPQAVAWSLALVVPGLWLRGYASGTVKKNRELAVTGPYAHTRNPLYLGSMLIAVIASEECFLRASFPGFDDYCRRVPRLIPRLTPASHPGDEDLSSGTPASHPGAGAGSFSFTLYLHHREYNAGMGAMLLYLCLLLLRPLLAAHMNLPR